MSPNPLPGMPMHQLGDRKTNLATDWLWDGYLARGTITLLTGNWKVGKTTLLTGLLQRLAAGGQFLGRRCEPARAWVVSEESVRQWVDRVRLMPVGPHAQLLSRPFLTRPTPAAWSDLVTLAIDARAAGGPDLFVVDAVAWFLTSRHEDDAATLLALLQPLRRLAADGAAVLLVHRPRQTTADDGSTAGGGGALPGSVDVILEMHRYGRHRTDDRRRRLVGLSRQPETPRSLVYEWDPATGGFAAVDDRHDLGYRENWKRVETIVAGRTSAATHHELRADWPADAAPPSAKVLYDWLNRATAERLVVRTGTGRRNDPYRYRLRTEEDADVAETRRSFPELSR
jgi:hypothetical protein